MSNLKYIQFVAVFIVGIVLGGGVMYIVMDTDSDNDKMAEVDQQNVRPTQENTSSHVVTKIPPAKSDSEEPDQPVKEIKVVEVDTVIHIDTVYGDVADSLIGDIDSTVFDDDPNVLIKKDVLLRTVELDLTGIPKDTSIIDTLAEHMNIKEVKHDKYKLELWQSPIGYSGYKVSGNRILMFGMDTIANFSLSYHEKGMKLQAGSSYYLIDNTSEFSPLTKWK